MKPALLKVLCCPDTHQKLHFAEISLIDELNRQIASGEMKNRGGKAVSVAVDAGLVREDEKYLYPIRNSIPVLIIEEGIAL